MKAYTKLTVVMYCQIFNRKSVAPSGGNFAAAAGAAVGLWTRSGISREKKFSKMRSRPLPQPRPKFRKRLTEVTFKIWGYELLGPWGPPVQN